MLFSDATVYVTTLIAITMAPGPLILMLMVRAAGNDTKGALGFGLGVAAGDVLVILLICLGLGTWLTASPAIAQFGNVALTAYLGWLAIQIWRGTFDLSGAETRPHAGVASSFMAGAGTCLISPQTLALYTLLLPRLMNVETASTTEFLSITALTFVALTVCFGLVIFCSTHLRGFLSSAANVTLVNRTLSCTLAAAGAWMVLG